MNTPRWRRAGKAFWRAAFCLSLLTALPGCEIKGARPEEAVAGIGGWKIRVGEKLPDFALPSTDGKQVTLADYAGRPVVMSLFATWCGPCAQELPQLESRVWQPMSSRGVQVIAISSGEDQPTVQQFLKRVPVSFPILLDEKNSYVPQIAPEGLPRLIITDRAHIVRHLEIGYYPPRFAQVVKRVDDIAGGSEEASPPAQ